ncbi:UNVERIFIED_CONTAM: hypothetical protein HHA_215900 [Hammondia hammondi]|eukprot:XP_008886330.1 hypothetical protein HHA_215900 [Hammondia hammondi]
MDDLCIEKILDGPLTWMNLQNTLRQVVRSLMASLNSIEKRMCSESQLSAAERRIDDLKNHVLSLPTHADLHSVVELTNQRTQEVRSMLLETSGKLQVAAEHQENLELRLKICEESLEKKERSLSRAIHGQKSHVDDALQKQWQAIKNLEELVRSVRSEVGVHSSCDEAPMPLEETHQNSVVTQWIAQREHDKPLRGLGQRMRQTLQRERIAKTESGVDRNELGQRSHVESAPNLKTVSFTLKAVPKQVAAKEDATTVRRLPAALIDSQCTSTADRASVGYLKTLTKRLVPLHQFEKLEAEFDTCTGKLKEAVARVERKYTVLSQALQSKVRHRVNSVSEALKKEFLLTHNVCMRSLQQQFRALAGDVKELKLIVLPFPNLNGSSVDYNFLTRKPTCDPVEAFQPEAPGISSRFSETGDCFSNCRFVVGSPVLTSEKDQQHSVGRGSGREPTPPPSVRQQNASSSVTCDSQYNAFRGRRQLSTRSKNIAPPVGKHTVTFPCVVQQLICLRQRLEKTEEHVHELQRVQEACVATLEEGRSVTAELQLAMEATENKFAQQLTACKRDLGQAAASEQAKALRDVQQHLVETMGKCLETHSQIQNKKLVQLHHFQQRADEQGARYAKVLNHVEEKLAQLKTLGDRVAKKCEEATAKTDRVCHESMMQREACQVMQVQMRRSQQQLQIGLRRLAEECKGDSHHLKAEQIHTRTELQAALVDFRVLREQQQDHQDQLKQLQDRCAAGAVSAVEDTVAKLSVDVEWLKAELQKLRLSDTRRVHKRTESVEPVDELLNSSFPTQNRRSEVEVFKAQPAFMRSANTGPLPQVAEGDKAAEREDCRLQVQRHIVRGLRIDEASRQALTSTVGDPANISDTSNAENCVGRWIWRSGARRRAPDGVSSMCLKVLASLKTSRQGNTDGSQLGLMQIEADDIALGCALLSRHCRSFMVWENGCNIVTPSMHASDKFGPANRPPPSSVSSQAHEAVVRLVVWDGEATNSCVDAFHWQQGTQFVDILSPGLYEVIVGIFGRVNSCYLKHDAATNGPRDGHQQRKETLFVQRGASIASEASAAGTPKQCTHAVHCESRSRFSGVFLVVNGTCVIKAPPSVAEINNQCSAPQLRAPCVTKEEQPALKPAQLRKYADPSRSVCLSGRRKSSPQETRGLDTCDVYSEWSTAAATQKGASSTIGTCDEHYEPSESDSPSSETKLAEAPNEPVLVPDILHTFLLLPAKARVGVAIAEMPVSRQTPSEKIDNMEGSVSRRGTSSKEWSTADPDVCPWVDGAGFLTLRKL